MQLLANLQKHFGIYQFSFLYLPFCPLCLWTLFFSGEYLALTGEKLNGIEMIACGLATHYTLNAVSSTASYITICSFRIANFLIQLIIMKSP